MACRIDRRAKSADQVAACGVVDTGKNLPTRRLTHDKINEHSSVILLLGTRFAESPQRDRDLRMLQVYYNERAEDLAGLLD